MLAWWWSFYAGTCRHPSVTLGCVGRDCNGLFLVHNIAIWSLYKTECFWFVLCGLILWPYCHFPFRITWQTSVNDAIQYGAAFPLFEDVCVLVTVFSVFSVCVTLGCCCSKSVKHINYKTVQRTNRNKNGECQLSLAKRNSLFGEWIEVASASTETLREFRYKYVRRISQYHFYTCATDIFKEFIFVYGICEVTCDPYLENWQWNNMYGVWTDNSVDCLTIRVTTETSSRRFDGKCVYICVPTEGVLVYI